MFFYHCHPFGDGFLEAFLADGQSFFPNIQTAPSPSPLLFPKQQNDDNSSNNNNKKKTVMDRYC